MLHKLALVSNNDNPSLLKEAIVSPEEDRLIKERLAQKQRTLAYSRGHSVAGDMDKLRMSKTKIYAPEAYKKSPGLIDKAVQEAQGTVSQSPAKQMHHQVGGKLKRLWGGKGFLGGKWRNRAGIVGGLGALGLGIKAYMDSNKALEPLAQSSGPQEEYPSYEDLYYSKQGAAYGSKYVQDAVTIPVPPAIGKVPTPGPGIASVATIKPKSIGAPGGAASSPAGGTAGASGGGASTKVSMDEGILPLLGLGAGGVGGWALAKKLIDPMMDKREQALKEQLKNTQRWRKGAPIGAAAAGALLLAALAAAYTKRNQEQGPAPQYTPYDPTNGGYYPNEQVSPGNFYG